MAAEPSFGTVERHSISATAAVKATMQAALKRSKAEARLLDLDFLDSPTPSTRFDDEEMNRDGNLAERFEPFYVLRCIVSATVSKGRNPTFSGEKSVVTPLYGGCPGDATGFSVRYQGELLGI